MVSASDVVRWLQRKRYQYEITFSLYMMTPTEKFIFSMSYPPNDPEPHLRTSNSNSELT